MKPGSCGIRSVLLSSLAAALAGGAGPCIAQTYPVRSVHIITGPAGSGTDITARVVAADLSGPLGQSVVVESRPAGPSASIAFSKMAPDGYNLLVAGSGHWTAPLFEKLPYDPVRDFSSVVTLARLTTMLVVHPSVAARNVAELIALARSQPGQLNVAVGPVGGSQHIAAELFKSMARLNITSIAYKGGPTQDVVAGTVHMSFNPPGTWAPFIKAGKVRALATTSAQRSALSPDLPTVGETLPGYEAEGLNALFAPARTPEAFVMRLNQEIGRVLEKPDVRQRLLNAGLEPVGGAPEVLTTKMQSEMARVGQLIQAAGLTAQ